MPCLKWYAWASYLRVLALFETLSPLELFHENQHFKALMEISLDHSPKNNWIHLRVVHEAIFHPYHMHPNISRWPEWTLSGSSGSLTEAAEPFTVLGYWWTLKLCRRDWRWRVHLYSLSFNQQVQCILTVVRGIVSQLTVPSNGQFCWLVFQGDEWRFIPGTTAALGVPLLLFCWERLGARPLDSKNYRRLILQILFLLKSPGYFFCLASTICV